MIQVFINELRTLAKMNAARVGISVYLIGLYAGLLAVNSGVGFFSLAANPPGMPPAPSNSEGAGLDVLIWAASFSHYFLAAMFILMVAPEWTNRTFKQRVINGESKLSCLGSKAMIGCLLLALGLAIINAFAGFEGGFKDVSVSEALQLNLYYMIQGIGYLGLAATFLFSIRSGAPTVLAFLFYAIIGEMVIGFILNRYVHPSAELYLPSHILSELIASPLAEFKAALSEAGEPTLPPAISYLWLAIGVVAVSWGTAFGVFNRRDLR